MIHPRPALAAASALATLLAAGCTTPALSDRSGDTAALAIASGCNPLFRNRWTADPAPLTVPIR